MAASKKKYYAVRVGLRPGVYETWDEARNLVHAYPGAIYKSFPTREEAVAFVKGSPTDALNAAELSGNASGLATGSDTAYAFVDGSFNAGTGVYGYGGFLMADGKRYVLQGSGDDPELASMRNVAGEIAGSMAAVKKALELKLDAITIYYDYAGIEAWATGEWKRNKAGTIAYHDFMQVAKDKIRISFSKVKGHSGVEGNEEADRLAKEAVNLIST